MPFSLDSDLTTGKSFGYNKREPKVIKILPIYENMNLEKKLRGEKKDGQTTNHHSTTQLTVRDRKSLGVSLCLCALVAISMTNAI